MLPNSPTGDYERHTDAQEADDAAWQAATDVVHAEIDDEIAAARSGKGTAETQLNVSYQLMHDPIWNALYKVLCAAKGADADACWALIGEQLLDQADCRIKAEYDRSAA